MKLMVVHVKKGTQEGGRERGREEGGRKGGREKQQIPPAVDFPHVPLVVTIRVDLCISRPPLFNSHSAWFLGT